MKESPRVMYQNIHKNTKVIIGYKVFYQNKINKHTIQNNKTVCYFFPIGSKYEEINQILLQTLEKSHVNIARFNLFTFQEFQSEKKK